MKRIKLIDFLKGLCIFTILLFHYLNALPLPSPYAQGVFFGGTGAHLFILLSGLGLYLSHLKAPLSYGAFLKRRFSKVYLPYLGLVLLAAFLSLFLPLYDNSWYALGGHVFLYKMWDESIMGSYGYPLWFMSMIFQFYLVFPLLVSLKKRISTLPFLLLCLLISLSWSVLVVFLGKESERVWNSFFLQYLWEFALGMVLASWWVQGYGFETFKRKPLFYLLLGSLSGALYATLALKGGEMGRLFNDLPAVLSYSSIALAVYFGSGNKIKSFFLLTGKLSFSLYLIHSLVFELGLLVWEALPLAFLPLICLMSTYILAFYYQKFMGVVFTKIESPALKSPGKE